MQSIIIFVALRRFLFETDKERILYTGDFRIDIHDFTKFIKSKKSMIQKRIDKIYLDTTFLDPDYEYFPTRYESASKVCEIIKEWLQKNSKTVINIETPGKFGATQNFENFHKIFCKHFHTVIFSFFNLFE